MRTMHITTATEYEAKCAELVKEASYIENSKRPGYTAGHPDVLHNFKTVAERVGITPGQCWAVYFLKHVDAITAIMCQPELPVSEVAIGRFADAINYLKLGYAMQTE